MEDIKVMLDPGAFMPERAHEEDAGMDLRTPKDFILPAGGSAVIDTGVHIGITKGFAGFLKSKSGLNVKHGITSEGVIDAGYTGSIVAKLYSHSDVPYEFKAGDKITQIVILPVALPVPVLAESLDDADSERGDAGFGSTGR